MKRALKWPTGGAAIGKGQHFVQATGSAQCVTETISPAKSLLMTTFKPRFVELH